jgi:hypothetical protein
MDRRVKPGDDECVKVNADYCGFGGHRGKGMNPSLLGMFTLASVCAFISSLAPIMPLRLRIGRDRIDLIVGQRLRLRPRRRRRPQRDLAQWIFAFHITIAKHPLGSVLHASERWADVV